MKSSAGVESPKALSIVIPTYNEKDNIVNLVEAIHSVLKDYDYEIVFVDDNSRDGTIELARSLAGRYPVKILVRTNEKGLATAVIYGFNNTTGKNILVMDADLQHPPQVIPAMLEAIKKADIVVGSRYVPGGGCENWGFLRRLNSRGAIALSHLFLPRTRAVKDPVSGFFMLRRSVLEGAHMNPIGYKILMELLYEGNYRKVTEVPFMFLTRSQGASKLKIKTEIDYLKHIFSLMRRGGEIVRFIKFAAVGASGAVVNFGLYAILTRFANLLDFLALGISIEASIISNFILNDRFTFADRRVNGRSNLVIRFLKFNAVSLFAAGVQFGVFALLNRIIGVYDLIANIVGIAAAMLINYFVNNIWTWKWQQE